MTIYLYQSFLADLHAHGDNGFAQRVIRKMLNANGSFRPDSEDHRYDGIDDAWIRRVSAGHSAYRAIYIRRGEDIYFYRCGEHSIEDRLESPATRMGAAEIADSRPGVRFAAAAEQIAGDAFRQNGRNRRLNAFLLGRRLIPHREVVLVSPYLSIELLERTTRLGLALDQLREDGSKLTLITRWPSPSDLEFFRGLEARGWEILFHQTLHAKLYVFFIDRDRAPRDQGLADAALIGSANLTNEGFDLGTQGFNEELCYELPTVHHAGAMDFITQLALQADDLTQVRHKLTRRAR